ncbi:MAG: Arc family DNA-binding protein [Stenotrophomonas acidaminiphila]|jgi:hypothetical protein|uniref:Arc family DNA-binding protein n=1 Tax=Stenotrophomonas acidaminiphila TaxID=128780 RepID=UPI000B32D8C4|nr:Arc family DNA-binding protein [Stenotrophomonas acidaminiphila]MBN8802309.1 Arc family DNA-binding protein [Stenotrophomonas acidaminiphila]MDF9443462.1 Arc family DNA-binding protein [Stenotrophomonas acidaminiphila]
MKDEIVPLVLRVPESLRDWLRKKAEADTRSMNFLTNRLLREAMEADQEKAA